MIRILLLCIVLLGCSPTSILDKAVGEALSSPLVETNVDTQVGDKEQNLDVKIGGEERNINTGTFEEHVQYITNMPTEILIFFTVLSLVGWMAPKPTDIWNGLINLLKGILLFIPNFVLRLLGKKEFK